MTDAEKIAKSIKDRVDVIVRCQVSGSCSACLRMAEIIRDDLNLLAAGASPAPKEPK